MSTSMEAQCGICARITVERVFFFGFFFLLLLLLLSFSFSFSCFVVVVFFCFCFCFCFCFFTVGLFKNTKCEDTGGMSQLWWTVKTVRVIFGWLQHFFFFHKSKLLRFVFLFYDFPSFPTTRSSFFAMRILCRYPGGRFIWISYMVCSISSDVIIRPSFNNMCTK